MSSDWLFRAIYGFGLVVYGLFQLPKYLFQAVRDPLCRSVLAGRLGLNRPQFGEGRPRVWLHAVSLGEVRAAARLIEQLGEVELLVSTLTVTGLAEAKRLFPSAHVIPLPFDLSGLIRPLVRSFRPELLLVTETDYWFNFLDEAKRVGSRIVVVNGKVSQRSASRYQRMPWYSRRLFARIDRFCLQDRIYFDRFRSLGIPEERLVVTGNIKFDQRVDRLTPEECRALRRELLIPEGAPIIVAGSTHDPEERALIAALKLVWRAVPEMRLLIVPRHPERFEAVAPLCDGRYSQRKKLKGEERTLLIDAMGMLCSCYQIATLALVAGSWTDRIGGHNILEPIHCSIPPIFGPYMHSQPTLERVVLGFGAGEQLAIDRLGERVAQLLTDPREMEQLVGRVNGLRHEMGGAVEATVKEVKNLWAL